MDHLESTKFKTKRETDTVRYVKSGCKIGWPFSEHCSSDIDYWTSKRKREREASCCSFWYDRERSSFLHPYINAPINITALMHRVTLE